MNFTINLDCGTYVGEFISLPGLTTGVLNQTTTNDLGVAVGAVQSFLSSHGAPMPKARFINLAGLPASPVSGVFGMGAINLWETEYLQWWDYDKPNPSIYADGGYCRRYPDSSGATAKYDIFPNTFFLRSLIGSTKCVYTYNRMENTGGASCKYLATNEGMEYIVNEDGVIDLNFQGTDPLRIVSASVNFAKRGEDSQGKPLWRYTYAASIGVFGSTIYGEDPVNSLKIVLNGTRPETTSGTTGGSSDPFLSGGTSGGQGSGGSSSGSGASSIIGSGTSGTGGGTAGGGVSGAGGSGGTGTQTWTSTPVPVNTLPVTTASDAGFITLYNPTLQELKDLSSYMWSDLFTLDTLKRIFLDPMDIILGLNILPVPIPNGGRSRLKIAGFSTGVSMTKAASQYVTFDCGSVTVPEVWGAYLDYAPYTKTQLYLPYIGTVNINTDDVMGRTVRVVYKVDILTGACMAQLHVAGGTHCEIDSVLYHFSGNCAQNIPVTGSNFSNLIASILGLTATAISTAAGIPVANSAVEAGTLASAAGQASIDYHSSLRPGLATDASVASDKAAIGRAEHTIAGAQAAKTMGITRGIQSAVGYVMSSKPQINRSGSISPQSGIFGVQHPYFIITSPRQSLAYNYNNYVGYPSNITEDISSLSGYTIFEKVVLEDMPCTDSELAELYELLYSGVYF